MNEFWASANRYFTEIVLFRIEDVGITLSHLAVAAISVLLALFVSRLIRAILRKRIFARMSIDKGVEYALLRFVHFVIVAIGVYIGLKSINLPLGAIVGLFAVLGVGIGFGLQNVASNFVSGVILLLERPVRVGDRLEIGDLWGDVIQINLRTTLIRTPDNIMIIVPNSRLLEGNLTNYSFGEERIRLRIPVGVAYGSDIGKVRECLLAAARDEKDVLTDPEPKVWFREFGSSSLNFELLAWIADPAAKYWVISSLNEKIDKLFREASVEIPFPQMDLHVRQSTHPLRLERADTGPEDGSRNANLSQ